MSKDVSFTPDTVAPAPPVFDLAAGYASEPGTTEPNATVSFGTITAPADRSGQFRIPTLLAVGNNNIALTTTAFAANTSLPANKSFTRVATTTSNEAALDWNNSVLTAITLDGSQPPVASRSLTMVSSAMYDAVNSVSGASSFLDVRVAAPLGSNDIAADNTLLDAAGSGTAGSKLTNSFTTVST